MKNLKMFCLTLEPKHLNFIKSLNYIPVGLGEKSFSNKWMTDKTGNNISEKNKNYGEYTFHYWIWKNYIDKLDDSWIGFAQYRKFWTINNYEDVNLNIDSGNLVSLLPPIKSVSNAVKRLIQSGSLVRLFSYKSSSLNAVNPPIASESLFNFRYDKHKQSNPLS